MADFHDTVPGALKNGSVADDWHLHGPSGLVQPFTGRSRAALPAIVAGFGYSDAVSTLSGVEHSAVSMQPVMLPDGVTSATLSSLRIHLANSANSTTFQVSSLTITGERWLSMDECNRIAGRWRPDIHDRR